MTSNLKKIKEIIASDKRSCERLELPLKIRYLRAMSPADQWSDYVWLDNIGGEGLGFTDDFELSMGDKIDIELKIPSERKSFYMGGEIVWIRRNFLRRGEIHLGKYSYGLKIYRLEEEDKKKFEQFISDSIIEKYLDDQGKFRKREGKSYGR
ncbi:MAG: PilZ domain-containing protein [Candidatus Omnitrophota bacterium]